MERDLNEEKGKNCSGECVNESQALCLEENYTKAKFILWACFICWTALRLLQVRTS